MAYYKFRQKPLAIREFKDWFPARFACGNTQAGRQAA